MTNRSHARAALGAAMLALGLGALAPPAAAQWSQQHEQFYMPAEHNWVFRRNYPAADRLFNAFDYGHAILYEKLYTRPGAPASELEEDEYDFVTRRLLVSPPRLPLEEGAIEIAYVKLAPEAKLMFEWAHILHRQMYDILADERLSQAEKDAEVAALLSYYKSRPDLAFSSQPKNMELMEGQYYSTAFRDGWPKFNGLIWAYHWLQVGLYEPLMTGDTPEERQTGVLATVARFRQMLENAPENLPRVMPMTPAVAPVFAARYPEAAIIFDNLHGMHDVISDILASPLVPRERKREEILRAAERYRDNTSFVMTEAEWRDMSRMMGIENMGGPVSGFLAGFPTPTVERGAVMAHGAGGTDHAAMGHAQSATPAAAAPAHDHGAMQPAPTAPAHDHGAMQPAAAAPAHDHGAMQPAPAAPAHDHGAMQPAPAAPAHDHGAMQPAPAAPAHDHGAMHAGGDTAVRAFHQGMMADPVIRARVAEVPELRAAVEAMHAMHAMQPGADTAAAALHRRTMMAFMAAVIADPQVDARIHADPRLHALWSDPAVQRHLAEVRGARPAAPAHQH